MMKTEVLLNFLGFIADVDPGPVLLVEPRAEDAKALSKDRVAPMFRQTPCLRGKIAAVKSRDSNNTTLHKVFTNGSGHITFTGAISPSGLAMPPIRYLLALRWMIIRRVQVPRATQRRLPSSAPPSSPTTRRSSCVQPTHEGRADPTGVEQKATSVLTCHARCAITSRYSSGHKGLPDESVSKNYSLGWTYSQDAKARPGSRFAASVNMSSSDYDRNNSYNIEDQITTNKTVQYQLFEDVDRFAF